MAPQNCIPPQDVTRGDDAEECVRQLKDALARHGIVLPSLDVEPPPHPHLINNQPLIELGRCNLPTAQALINALSKGER